MTRTSFFGGPASTLYRCWREIGHGVDLALGTSYRGMRVFGFCYATSSRCTEGSDSKLKEVIDLFFSFFCKGVIVCLEMNFTFLQTLLVEEGMAVCPSQAVLCPLVGTVYNKF